MVNVRVLFFGATADEVGRREIEIDLDEQMKANDFFVQILASYPQLKRHSLLLALNQEYSKGDEIIKNGDELAIFTAVSGG